ncbi:MAG: efflux RND transporter periplasmic adaptor subunit [Bacteroidota bacterium]
MKRLFILLFILTGLLLAACGSGDDGHSHDEGADHSHEETAQQTEEEHGHAHPEENEEHEHDEESERTGSGSVTQWSDETELFMEFPELIVGKQATFAVHLTRLSDFSPIADSEVYFTFRSDDGTEITRRETEVQTAGIYGPDVAFQQAGRYDLTIEIYGMVNDTLQVNDIPVYESADEVPATHEDEDPNQISFLKEQQWDIPFGTREVQERTLTQTVDAHGETMAAQNSQAVVSAPFSGIILPSQNASLPVEGQQLQKGASLAVLNPAVQSGGGDNYVQQFVSAQSQLELTQSNFERSKRLYEKEAIPERELQQARLEYRQALTRYQTINEVIQIDTTAIDGSGSSADSYRLELKAPVAGSIIESHVAPGMQVEAGQPLYRIADASRVWLKAHVPASRQNQIANAQDASFRVQGDDQLYTISELGGSLISRSNSVDPQSRTLSLIYEFDNTEKGLPLGMFSTVYINTDTKEQVLAIPESALMEEEGSYNVYVHVSGESFEKRRVTTGIKEGGWVEISSGLQEGEHVVTENAYQVELASRSSETPEHGHSH